MNKKLINKLQRKLKKKSKLHDKNNIKRAKKEKLCFYCKFYNGHICSKHNKNIFNHIGSCSKYISANNSDNSDTFSESFAEYKVRIESLLNPPKHMHGDSSHKELSKKLEESKSNARNTAY